MSDVSGGQRGEGPLPTDEPTGEDPADPSPDSPSEKSWSVFGDAVGLAVFLGALVLGGLTWQLGFFITDNYALANGLVNLAEGHLSIDRFYYSLSLRSQPGLHLVDGQVYARNYGQLFLALPVYYALDWLTVVAELQLLLIAGWCLTTLIFCRQVGIVVGRRRQFQLVGSALAVSLFAVNVPIASLTPDAPVGLAALQVVSIGAVATTGLALYRLVAVFEGQRVAAVVACGTVVASPLWFWAAIPKRHTLTVAAVAVLLYWFAVSRHTGARASPPFTGRSVSKPVVLRCFGYLLVGVVAWIHVFEGLVLLGTFATADLSTASTNSRRTVLALGLVLVLGLTPFFATNLVVSGDATQPPRTTSGYSPGADGVEVGPGGEVISTADGPSDASSGGSGEEPSSNGDDQGGDTADGETGDAAGDGNGGAGDSDPDVGAAEGFDPSVVDAVGRTIRKSGVDSYVSRATDAIDRSPRRLYHTYLRSGRLPRNNLNRGEAIDLTLVESTPLLGGIVAAVLTSVTTAVRGARWGRHGRDPRGFVRRSVFGRLVGRVRTAAPQRQTAGFAVLVVLGYATLYFPFLPLGSQITVRYVLPVVPAGVYLLTQSTAVTGPLDDAFGAVVGSYLAFAFAGFGIVAFGLPGLELAIGEAMQLHALVNLAVATLLALALLPRSVGVEVDSRAPAVALGLAGAATTVLVASMHLEYFEYGTYVVPLARLVADAIQVLA